MTIRQFVEARLAAGDSTIQAWRAAQKHFEGGWQIVGWGYVQRIARDRIQKQIRDGNAKARAAAKSRGYSLHPKLTNKT